MFYIIVASSPIEAPVGRSQWLLRTMYLNLQCNLVNNLETHQSQLFTIWVVTTKRRSYATWLNISTEFSALFCLFPHFCSNQWINEICVWINKNIPKCIKRILISSWELACPFMSSVMNLFLGYTFWLILASPSPYVLNRGHPGISIDISCVWVI